MKQNIYGIILIIILNINPFFTATSLADNPNNHLITNLPKPFDDIDLDKLELMLEGENIITKEWNKMASMSDVPVRVFMVPRAEVIIYTSENNDVLQDIGLIPNADGKIRILVPLSDGIDVYKQMELIYGPPELELKGNRMQGKSTFVIPNLNSISVNSLPSFYIKTERYFFQSIENMKLIRINKLSAAKESVDNSSTFEKLLKFFPHPLIGQFRETAAISLKEWPFKGKPNRYSDYMNNDPYGYTLLIRERPKETLNLPFYKRFLPLHGTLSANVGIPLMAKLAELSETDWILNEYLPKFAEVIAHINLKLGIWVEGHTQNFSSIMNLENGKFEMFFPKDWQDIMRWPALNAIDGFVDANSSYAPGILNSSWINEHDPSYLKYAGPFTQMYVGQSIWDITKSLTDKRKFTGQFLKYYAKTAQNILGSSKALDALVLRHQKKLDELINGQKIEIIENRFVSEINSNYNYDFKIFTIEFIQQIADLFVGERFRQFLAQADVAVYKAHSQDLRVIFENQFRSREINWATFGADQEFYKLTSQQILNQVEFIPMSRDTVMAYDRNSKTPFGLAYNLSNVQKDIVGRILIDARLERITLQNELKCSDLLR